MRLDIITVFPAFFDVLDLSLLGKARSHRLLDTQIHDLRGFTHDRHRTVDDTPYGGGPGMLMRPEPWGDALDEVCSADQAGGQAAPLLVVPTPAGQLFSQGTAWALASQPWLVFACGRYEGIDQRVIDDARDKMPVLEVSVGDYVLNGGEAATLVMVEAVARLVPGVIGNEQSLLEESHAGGLVEAPSYTKPATWRGRDVPSVLRSGNHQAIARWRRVEAIRRTNSVRPDLIEQLDPETLSREDQQVLGDLGWHITNGRFFRSPPTVAD